MLDTPRLKTELGNIQAHLVRVVMGPRGAEVTKPLRDSMDRSIQPGRLLWQALHNDCLRVVYVALTADDQVLDEEIEATYEFLFSVARHYAELLPSVYGAFSALDAEMTREFLASYAADAGPFGFASDRTRWAGLDACRRAAVIGDSEPLERYSGLIGWLCDEAIRVAGVETGVARSDVKLAEIESLRRTLALRSSVPEPGTDLRIQAFLGGPRVFAAVTHADSVFEDDPFDVEDVHGDVRETFERLVNHAVSPMRQGSRGRMLLVLGDSGAGKTHLMRAFRSYVHHGGHGFAVYAQLQSRAREYGRYLLHNVIESLERRYGTPGDDASGLLELARGLPRLLGGELHRSITRLAEEDWNPADLTAHIDQLVDELLRHEELSRFDPDLLRILLYLQCDDPRITPRALKYLRCEPINAADQRWIGNVQPRVGADEPVWMIQQLARLAFVTQEAAFVIMVDQAELAGFDAGTVEAFNRAVDALYSISSVVPSVVVVIACLSDMYTGAKPTLTNALLDRLTLDPPRAMLATQRTAPEIAAIIGRRLEWLYEDAGAVFRREDATYPIPPTLLSAMVGFRTRAVLDLCHQFQQACSAAGRVLEDWSGGDEDIDRSTDGSGVRIEDIERMASDWNELLHSEPPEVPEDPDEILELLAEAASACRLELDVECTVSRRDAYLDVDLGSSDSRQELTIGFTNKGFARGAFGREIDGLRKTAGSRTPVSVRTVTFPPGPISAAKVADLLKAGGRRVLCSVADLRALVAMKTFAAQHAGPVLDAWRRRDRPVLRRDSLAEMFAAANVEATGPKATDNGRERSEATPLPSDPPEPPPPPPPPRLRPVPAGHLHIGTTSGLDPRSVDLSPEVFVRHSGVLGSPGSGKTTLALNLIEQLLERDIAVVLVDRKGDLAGYARADWFQSIPDREQRTRAEALARRIDARLFTPGTGAGRPLSFGVVPSLEGVVEHDRNRVVAHAASALAAMLRLGTAGKAQTKRAILGQAIGVLSDRVAPAGLEALIDLIHSRDDLLVSRVSKFDDKLFDVLVSELETLRLNESELFDRTAEQLSADILLGRGADGKTPLSIVSTRFLGDTDRVQAWTSHLFVELARYSMRAPQAKLQALVMLDEADQYMPATSKPPSKEPLMDLLKRARSGGLGVMLATQTPGDLDYKSRDLITTWFIGKIGDSRSVEKVRPLLDRKPAMAGKLAQLPAGQFVVVDDTSISEIQRRPSLLRTDQLPEHEIVALARGNRR